jgi:hypothetical protein
MAAKNEARGETMKANWNAKYLLAVLAIAALAISSAAALAKRQEKSAAQNPAPKPGAAEMERLKFYLGEWDYTETYSKSKELANGGQDTGVYTSKLGPGGNSLINTFHTQGPFGDFEGLLIMTWDPKEQAYKQYGFANNFPGAIVETGQFEGDALVFRGEFTMGVTKIAVRNSTRLVAPGKLVSDEFSSANGAPEKLFLRVEAKKR